MRLHNYIRAKLVEHYGKGESGWWRQAVPEVVRVKCFERREKDADSPCPPYSYTDLIDLARILDSQWSVLKDAFPTCYSSNKKALLADLNKFNRVRNKVMHPVRGVVPTDEDFDFVRRLHENVPQNT